MLRLRAVSARTIFGGIFGGRQVIGYVGETSLVLARRRWILFPTRLRLQGELLDENDRTRLRCRVVVPLFVRIFTMVFFAFALVAGIQGLVDAIPTWWSGEAHPNLWLIPVLIVWGMVTAGPELLFIQQERQFWGDFLRRTVDAHETTSK